MSIFRSIALVLALFTAAAPAAAQWQTPNHSVPIGQGAGNTGFRNAAPGTAGLPLVSNGPAADPSFKNPDLTAIVNAVCTLSPNTCARIWGYVNPIWYGAVCDGVTNDAAALQAAITGSAGKTIFIPAGTCLSNTSLAMPSNTTITGAGRDISILKSTANLALQASNASNISLTNFQVLGTNSATSWAASVIGAIGIFQDVSASVPGHDYTIQGMKFAGWNATYWIAFSATGSLQPVTNVSISNNYFLSDAASVPADANPLNDPNWFITMYSGSAGNGQYQNTVIDGNRMEATGMCFGVILFSNHTKYRMTNNIISNPGVTTPGHCTNSIPATNGYGIAVYDLNADGFPPANGVISGNVITNPTAAGIYVVGDGDYDLLVANNNISGQTASDEALPRAAISINAAGGVLVTGNYLKNNYGGIALSSQKTGTVVAQGNYCYTAAAAGAGTLTPYCVLIAAGSNGSSNTSRHIVKDNYLEVNSAAADAIRSTSQTSFRFYDVEVAGNTINASVTGFDFSSQFVTGSATIRDNKFGGVASGRMLWIAATTGTPITLMNNVFDSIAGVAGKALVANSATFNMSNSKFINRASGAVPMYDGSGGSCGTINGTQFNNVVQPAQVAAGSLGLVNPSGCTLNYQDFVQNLAPVTPSTISGWLHASTTTSTTHVPLTFP